ncbi:uncharacterized protein [Watersipora subatra]|uniref:uncharacterized protein n=1 Tax=Watersipora subatra TaxID=2589382 RepID=UPI00355BE84A
MSAKDGYSESPSAMDFVRTWRENNAETFSQHSGISNSTLDVSTLKWKSWTSSANEDICKNGRAAQAEERARSKSTGQDPLYHLTKTEFRRLTEQLRDVNWNLSNRFKGIGFNRFKGQTGLDSGSACLYRSQLALSNKAFNDEQQMWRPYTETRSYEPVYTRCRPVSHQVQERERRPRVAVTSSRNRPKSTPISNTRTGNNVSWGDYDMLTADIVQSFQQDDDLKGKFGEKILIIGKDRKGERKVEFTTGGSADDKHGKSESSTSGVASLDSEDVAESLSESEPDDQRASQAADIAPELLDEGRQSLEDDDRSDDETIPEPNTPLNPRKINVPGMEWHMRPERLDSRAIVEGKRDRHRYDFDASYIRQPKYEFSNVFSPALMSLDLRALAEREASLEMKPKVDKIEAKIMMRCFELEKLQLATEKVEDSRFSKTKQYIRQRSASSALSKLRAQSAKSTRSSSKCAQECTQVICVGDCPEKSMPCSTCNKKSCNGICVPVSYSLHTRLPEESLTETKYRLPRPKSCSSCSKPSNPAKKINQQHTQMGRPKSSHSTYAHAKKSHRQVLDLRGSTQQLDVNQIPYDEKIHNRPQTSPSRLKSAKTRKGRDSVAPHKSYYSQRRMSLTANTVRPVFDNQVKRILSAKSH